MNIIRSTLIIGLIIGVAWLGVGCSGTDDNKSASTDGHKDEAGKNHKQPGKDDAHKDDNVATKDDQKDRVEKDKAEPKHGGWWCEEHGIPEEICSLCMSDEDVKKKFKDKGDWCEKHERAKSQCFKCNPKLYERFVAMYKAKYGKEPPRPPVDEFKD